MQSYIIGSNEAGMRLDRLIERLLPSAGKGFAYKMLRKKNIVLNGKRAEGPERLNEGDEVKFFLSDETFTGFGGIIGSNSNEKKAAALSAVTGGFDFSAQIIYEDRDVILVNKPEGILSQKASEDDISLNEYLIGYLREKGVFDPRTSAVFRPAVCNRLDRNTSGIVCCGVSMNGLRELSKMFRDRTVHKYYLALCKGSIREPGHKKAYLVKDGKTNKVRILDHESGDSQVIETAWKPLEAIEDATWLEVELFTGKSHQIRAQLSSIGHPIAGDSKYGDEMFNRTMRDRFRIRTQALYAYRIVFPADCGLEGIAGKEFSIDVPLKRKTASERRGD